MSGIDLSTLNDRQLGIVRTLDRPVFVEAGAGSGKTFTLTRRIAWALSPGSGEDGAPFLDDLSQVLVITFTNAAAREIKERVRSTLRSAGMGEAALQVDSAWISTIHGMCSRILRRHALDLGLDPRFRVASGNEAKALMDQALEEVVGSAVRQGGDPLLAAALDEYGLGGTAAGTPNGVVGIVSALMDAAHSAPRGFDSLELVGQDDLDGCMERLQGAVSALGAQHGVTAKALEKIVPSTRALEGYAALAPGARGPEAALEALAGVSLPRSSKAIAELLPDAKEALALARAEAELSRVRPLAEGLVSLARQVDDRFMELKRSQSLLDNDDLVALALAAVRDDPAVAADYAGRFRLVMVDEFQDTDSRQLELIRLLSGEGERHLATVGDAQQSIYGFRGADVGVFRARGEGVPERDRIRLDVNYRSHADVLSFVDATCGGPAGVVRGFMHLDASPGRMDSYRARDLPRIDVELVEGAYGASRANGAVMAAAIADRLRECADHGERPGDMALLLGTTTNAALYIDALRARGIDCVVTGGSTFTATREAGAMAALLHTLANPHDTQSGLFPLLTSPMFELDANDFVQLGTRRQRALDAPTKRTIDRGLETMDLFGSEPPSARLRLAHDVLMRARLAMRRMPVADVCLQVVRESGWLARLERRGEDGRAEEANVLAAVRYVRDLTSELGLGPARAATEFDVWLQTAKVPPATLLGGELRSVRIMTIHASKGLEFPVVAVAECWSRMPDRGPVASSRLPGGGVGVCLKPKGSVPVGDIPVEERPESLSEWLGWLSDQSADAAAGEKARLLYVALTRAREALVLGLGVTVSKGSVGPELATGVLGALYYGAGGPGGLPSPGVHALDYGGSEPARLRCVATKVEGRGPERIVSADSAGTLVDGPLPAEPDDLFRSLAREGEVVPSDGGEGAGETFGLYRVEADPIVGRSQTWSAREGVFSYSSAHAQMTGAMDSADASAAVPPVTPTAGPAERASLQAESEGAPLTGDADRATNLGSAFHELAQAMVESGAERPDARRVERAKSYWGLSPRASARLDAARGRWCGSDLRAEVLSHGLVRAEVPFLLPVDSSYGDHVEGAIDLLATDEGSPRALLVDYKTGDRGLSPEQVSARHLMQANFYAYVLMASGFDEVDCRFACVEVDDGHGGPLVARYVFDGDNPPRI
jgi:ATP-dependent helicase/nuclease subunit A